MEARQQNALVRKLTCPSPSLSTMRIISSTSSSVTCKKATRAQIKVSYSVEDRKCSSVTNCYHFLRTLVSNHGTNISPSFWSFFELFLCASAGSTRYFYAPGYLDRYYALLLLAVSYVPRYLRLIVDNILRLWGCRDEITSSVSTHG